MSKATKTMISIDESESVGTLEYEEGYRSSSDESVSRPNSSPTREDEDDCNESEIMIARLNEELARVKALSKARSIRKKKAKKPCNGVSQQPKELNSPCNLNFNTRKRRTTDGKVDKNANENLVMQGKKKESKAIWTVDKVNHFIDLFEERTCLWDIFSQVYHNRERKQIAYSEIGDELNISVEEVKTKILNLRTQLGRELGKVKERKSGQSTSDLYKPTWIHWERLQFLCPVMNPGKSKDNFYANMSLTEGQEEMKSLENESPPQQSNTKHSKHATKRAMMEQKQELVTKCLDVLRKPDKQEEKPCHFSLFIAEKLRQMDRRTQAIAEKRIYDVIFNLEMNGPHFSGENEGQTIFYDGNLNMPVNNGPFMSYLHS